MATPMAPTTKNANHQVWISKSIILLATLLAVLTAPPTAQAADQTWDNSFAGWVFDGGYLGYNIGDRLFIYHNGTFSTGLGTGFATPARLEMNYNLDAAADLTIQLNFSDGSYQNASFSASPGSHTSAREFPTETVTEITSISISMVGGAGVDFIIDSVSLQAPVEAEVTTAAPSYGVFTTTLTSGDVVTVERRYSYGDQSVSAHLSFISVMLVLLLIVSTILQLRGRR